MGLITGWSPTKLANYEECPRKAMHTYVQSLCTLCFTGRTSGGFDGKPVTCDHCHREQAPGAPLVRGSRLGLSLEQYVKGERDTLDPEIQNLKALKLAKTLRTACTEKGTVRVEASVVLDSSWRPVSMFTKGAWFRGKLDVLVQKAKGLLHVIDWKSGGIDKKTGEVKASEK